MADLNSDAQELDAAVSFGKAAAPGRSDPVAYRRRGRRCSRALAQRDR